MIYLVEDDESIRELVVYTLKSQGMEAKGFERPSQFWKELDKEIPSLILLDVMLPEEDGISILKKLRTRPDTRKLPIIMLTAKGSEYDVVMGLDSGADDYIPKPFRMMELISRSRGISPGKSLCISDEACCDGGSGTGQSDFEGVRDAVSVIEKQWNGTFQDTASESDLGI